MIEEIEIIIETTQRVKLPTLPNFIRTGETTIRIQDLSQKQLQEIGRRWTEALMRKARDKAGDDIRALNKRLGNLAK